MRAGGSVISSEVDPQATPKDGFLKAMAKFRTGPGSLTATAYDFEAAAVV